MSLDLTSVEAKLAWARYHFEVVDKEISAWLDNDAHYILYEHNEDFTQHYLRAKFSGDRPDFTRWSLMLGDSITNLRDVLDHLVFAIANLPNSPRPDKRDKACFLITSRPKDFTDWGKTKLASVAQAVRNSMVSFQPFNRPNDKLPPLLTLLAELANGNKHRLLSLAFTSPSIAKVEFVTTSGIHQPASIGINQDDIQEDSIVLFLEVEKPDPQLKLDHGVIMYNVVLKHTPLDGDTSFHASRAPYRSLMNLLFKEVELIISTFASLVEVDSERTSPPLAPTK